MTGRRRAGGHPLDVERACAMEPIIDEDLTGRTVDHYAIVALIASGGQGRVYRGRDKRLHRDVAIKVLAPHHIGDPVARARLVAEARALSLLNHPSVAGIYDFVTHGRRDFIVMEFVPGATLRDMLAGGPLPAWEVVRLSSQIARGLAAAHAANVVHRDIKPANLKITSAGELKILDFGVAQLMPSGAVFDNATRTPSRVTAGGTIPYMSPEQIRGDLVDERSDIFSVGAVMYEMATGCPAFPDRSLAALVDAIQHSEPAPPAMVNPHLPIAVEGIITKAMEKDPRARHQSAIELAESLEALLPSGRKGNGHEIPGSTWHQLLTMGA
jgi:serine/threonine protein kinase